MQINEERERYARGREKTQEEKPTIHTTPDVKGNVLRFVYGPRKRRDLHTEKLCRKTCHRL